MSSGRSFAQVDVFSSRSLLGNPVAVVLDGDGLDARQMQRFTAWTNLSEATFVTRPGHPEADYAVRIFTGSRELPFAGHPTLGTCHAWLAAGGSPRGEVIIQECGIGLVRIRADETGSALFFAAPERRRSGPLDAADVNAISRGLGVPGSDIVDHQWCDNGPPWQTLLLRSTAQLRAVRPRGDQLAGRFVGVVAPQPPGADGAFEVRAFFPTALGIGEDPVTGSLHAAIGQWLIEAGRAPEHYRATQGGCVGRAGQVTVERIDDTVWIGGHCATVLQGIAAL
jgi:PhzF family phenazine biosynthesis protein